MADPLERRLKLHSGAPEIVQAVEDLELDGSLAEPPAPLPATTIERVWETGADFVKKMAGTINKILGEPFKFARRDIYQPQPKSAPVSSQEVLEAIHKALEGALKKSRFFVFLFDSFPKKRVI
jgi:hypothetical protein